MRGSRQGQQRLSSKQGAAAACVRGRHVRAGQYGSCSASGSPEQRARALLPRQPRQHGGQAAMRGAQGHARAGRLQRIHRHRGGDAWCHQREGGPAGRQGGERCLFEEGGTEGGREAADAASCACRQASSRMQRRCRQLPLTGQPSRQRGHQLVGDVQLVIVLAVPVPAAAAQGRGDVWGVGE